MDDTRAGAIFTEREVLQEQRKQELYISRRKRNKGMCGVFLRKTKNLDSRVPKKNI
jgi:hypothetical protein